MLRELDHREADGGRIAVSLDWDDETGEVTLALADETGTHWIAVPPAQARTAYLHPYAWLA